MSPTMLILMVLMAVSLSHCGKGICNPELPHGLLILNTIDGSFIGLNAMSGEVVWRIVGSPLISQSLSDLRLFTKSHDYSLVPSLDGQLFLLERRATDTLDSSTSLKALPLTVDALFSSHFMLTQDSALTGGKETSLFAFDPRTGQVIYNCSRDGCSSSLLPDLDDSTLRNSSHPRILVYRTNQIVRAVHTPSGLERWNLSVVSHDLCLVLNGLSTSTTLIRRGAPTCGILHHNSKDAQSPHENESPFAERPDSSDIGVEFSLDELLITARTKQPFSRVLWAYELPSRVVKSWIYRPHFNTLDSIRLFSLDANARQLMRQLSPDRQLHLDPDAAPKQRKTLRDYIKFPSVKFPGPFFSRSHKECPSRDRLVYLGAVNGQLYVQLEDGFDSPSPTHINLPMISTTAPTVSNEYVFTNTETKVDQTVQSMTGYYRASYSSHPTHSMCVQPFITDESDSSGSDIPTHMISWRSPEDTTSAFSDALDEESINVPNHSESREDRGFSQWMFQSASDLFILLLHADEISDQRYRKTQAATSSKFHNYAHILQITFLFLFLYLTDYMVHALREPRTSRSSACPTCSSSGHSSTDQSLDPVRTPISSVSASCGTDPTLDYQSIYENEFIFVRCLGRGGFGQVFEAENRFDGCRYAIKRIQMDETLEANNKFLREVKALASLDHPGIVRYHRAWSESPPPGWQQARDKLTFGSSDDYTEACSNGTQKSTVWTSDSCSQSSLIHPSGDWSSSCEHCVTKETDKRYSDFTFSNGPRHLVNRLNGDSSIVFQRTADASKSSTDVTADCSVYPKLNKSTSMPPSDYPRLSFLYIQMQLCSPVSLRDWLLTNNDSSLRPPRIDLFSMFRQIVDAVAYLHEHALMHRDLKPSNILFDLTSRLKLADFGLVTSIFDEEFYHCNAKVRSPNTCEQPLNRQSGSHKDPPMKSKNGAIEVRGAGRHSHGNTHTDHVGTDLYMSPEQERGDPYDYKVDIFSLGLIFVELLIPFRTTMERIHTLTQAKLQKLPERWSVNHPEETTFVLRLLDTIPLQRPSAAQILTSPLLYHVAYPVPQMQLIEDNCVAPFN